MAWRRSKTCQKYPFKNYRRSLQIKRIRMARPTIKFLVNISWWITIWKVVQSQNQVLDQPLIKSSTMTDRNKILFRPLRWNIGNPLGNIKRLIIRIQIHTETWKQHVKSRKNQPESTLDTFQIIFTGDHTLSRTHINLIFRNNLIIRWTQKNTWQSLKSRLHSYIWLIVRNWSTYVVYWRVNTEIGSTVWPSLPLKNSKSYSSELLQQTSLKSEKN